MKRDSYWFKHDANARGTLKLQKIKAIYGLEGLGIFWSLIEVLREQNFYRWPENEINILAKVIDCDINKLNNFLSDCKRIDLLTFHSGFIMSDRLKNDMQIWEKQKRNGSQMRAKQEAKREPNGHKESIGEKSIEEYKRVFNEFRVLFPGSKTGNNTEFLNFTKKHKDWREVLPTLEETVKRQIAYRAHRAKSGAFVPEWKMLKTWINNRCWEEETPIVPEPEAKRPAIPASYIFGDTNNK